MIYLVESMIFQIFETCFFLEKEADLWKYNLLEGLRSWSTLIRKVDFMIYQNDPFCSKDGFVWFEKSYDLSALSLRSA